MSYPEYKELFSKKVNFVDNAEDADVVIFGFVIDIKENSEALIKLQEKKPNIRLVVLSEEPLWDTLWSGDFFSKKSSVLFGDTKLTFTFLNHCTTAIYNFENFPYFITTSDEFFTRYRYYFARNSTYSESDIETNWREASTKIAFYSEKRQKKEFDIKKFKDDVISLSGLRSEIAEKTTGDGIVKIGQGWGVAKKRQALPDWHLDKLVGLDKRSYIVSAIENTHQKFYITEKIFDAFAVLGVPIYYASNANMISRLVPHGGYINTFGLPAERIVEKIALFQPDQAFVCQYKKTQEKLAVLFSNVQSYIKERERLVNEVVNELRLAVIS